MSTLAELRDDVEADLDDSSNDTWAAGEIDRAIAKALRDYSLVNPQQVVGTITLTADAREVSISSLTGLTRIAKVWFPYDSSDPDHPPNWVKWSLYSTTLYLATEDLPATDEVVRVFYHKLHTIEDLDGGTSTTVPAQDEEAIVIGAAAYAALTKARSSVGEVGASGQTPDHWMRWALNQIAAFNDELREIRRRELLKLDKRVPLEAEGWIVEDIEADETV